MTHPSEPAPERGEVEAVRLGDCPAGLFLFGSCLGFKTEYRGMETIGPTNVTGSEIRWVVGRHSEVFIVASGEVFWGGVNNKDAREDLLVRPVDDIHAALSSMSAEVERLRAAAAPPAPAIIVERLHQHVDKSAIMVCVADGDHDGWHVFHRIGNVSVIEQEGEDHGPR